MPRCSFCSEPAIASRPLVSGQGVAICGDCARLALEVVEISEPPAPDMVLRDIGSLLTMDRGPDRLGVRHDVAVVVRRGRLVWIGDTIDIPEPYRQLTPFDCDGRLVMPGLVDANTRLVGGPSTVRRDPELLAGEATDSLRRMTVRGVTLVDIEVGGGVEPTVETLELAVARSVAEAATATVATTWRCSIELGPGEIRRVMAPTAGRLASAAVVECQGGDPANLVRTIEALSPLRIRLDCHEPVPDACRDVWPIALSMQVRGLPAHVGSTTSTGARTPTLVVPWSTPGLAVSARAAGRDVALVTSSHPERRVLAGMGVVLLAAVDLAGLSVEEALVAVTRSAAQAIGEPERGRLALGSPADLVVTEGESVTDLLVRPDDNLAWAVIVGGRLVNA